MSKKKNVGVHNSADPDQVKKAEERDLHRRDQELEDLRQVISTEEGRRTMWRFMVHCKAFNSVWVPSAGIHYNSGQQDVGFYLINECEQADRDLFFKMMKENFGNKEGN